MINRLGMAFEQFGRAAKYVGFDEASAGALRNFHSLAEPELDAIVEDFYSAIASDPAASATITGGDAQVERLKRTLKQWLHSGLLGPHDERFLESRMRIGQVHVRIRLPQELMFTAMSRVRKGLVDLARAKLPHEASLLTVHAVNQLLDLELAIMLDSYRAHWAERVRAGERLATIGKFAASIGHELRNPLGVVESSTFLVGQRLGQLQVDDPIIKKHQERILHQLRACAATISSLLELARDTPPDRRPHGLGAIVDDATKTLMLGETLSVEHNFDPSLSVLVDESQLRQVFCNLLLNASHALEGRGKLQISAQQTRDGVEILVADDGPGIPEELRERVFDIWFTTKANGTGVGLALSRKIVEAHGGTLSLERPERGSCFRILLPAT